MGYQAIKQGPVVFYRSIFDVVRDFLHAEALSDEKVLGKHLKPDLLIVDDMGMKQLPKRSGEWPFVLPAASMASASHSLANDLLRTVSLLRHRESPCPSRTVVGPSCHMDQVLGSRPGPLRRKNWPGDMIADIVPYPHLTVRFQIHHKMHIMDILQIQGKLRNAPA
jgi:hypothetical protein